MAQYEIMYLFSPQYSEEEIQTEITKLNQNVQNLEGSIQQEEHLGLLDLAYKIKHLKQGNYHTVWIQLAKDRLKELEKTLKTNNYLMRYLITTLNKNEKPFLKNQVPESKPESEQETSTPLFEKSLPKTTAPDQIVSLKKSAELNQKIQPKEKTSPLPEIQDEKKVKSKTSKKPKVEIEDLDKKLDEILNEKIL